jgi:hypothetical protein
VASKKGIMKIMSERKAKSEENGISMKYETIIMA